MASPANPDFSLAAKRKIADATRIVLGQPQGGGNVARPAFPRGGSDGFWAWSTGAVRDGSNFRWAYTFEEVEKTGAAFAGWATKSGGETGTMYNSIETANGASGLMGNGVDTTNFPAGGSFALQPLPNSRPIWVRSVYPTTGDRQFWFEYANGVDGACS